MPISFSYRMDTDNHRKTTSRRRGVPRLLWTAFAALLAATLSAGCGGSNANAPADGAAAPLVVAMMPEIPPYSYLDPDTGEPAGIDVDIIRAAAAKLGRPLEIHLMPFAGILPAVKKGEADFAIAAITITEGRSRDADFSDPYPEEGCAFLYRTGTVPPTMIRAETLHVGVVESMSGDFYLTRHGIEPYRYGSLTDAVADLHEGRLDAIFYDRPALLDVEAEAGGTLTVTPRETRERYGVAVRKGRPDLLDAVNAAIRDRREGGTP